MHPVLKRLPQGGSFWVALILLTTRIFGADAIYEWGRYSPTGNALPSPIVMGPLTGKTIVSVAVGEYHCMALTSDGEVYAWGSNNYGQLGDGTLTASDVPVKADAGGRKMTTISAGAYYSSALGDDGKLYIWGMNPYIGSSPGKVDHWATPTVHEEGILAGRVLTKLSAGYNHLLVLDDAGMLIEWRGILPGFIDSTKKVKFFSAGGHDLLVTESGTLYGHGANYSGELGDGSIGGYAEGVTPVYMRDVYTNDEILWLHAGSGISSMATKSGVLYTWGGANHQAWPTPMDPNTFDASLVNLSVASLAGGDTYTLVQMSDGTLASTGTDYLGVLGRSPSPGLAPLSNLRGKNIKAYAGGQSFGLAVVTTYEITQQPVATTVLRGGPASFVVATNSTAPVTYQWYKDGKLLIGETSATLSVAAAQDSNAGVYYAEVESGGLTLTTDRVYLTVGSTWAQGWGYGDYGALGTGSNGSTATAAPLAITADLDGQTPLVQVIPGYTSFAIDANGHLFGWGDASMLGVGYRTDVEPTARAISVAGKTVASVSVSGDHVLALTTDGQVYAWGENDVGQLGDNTVVSRWTPAPVDVTGDLADVHVIAISAAYHHSMALGSNGLVYEWGENHINAVTTPGGFWTMEATPKRVDLSRLGSQAAMRVKAISSGLSNVALTVDGRVLTWGFANSFGQLGNGVTTQTDEVVLLDPSVFGGEEITSISAGNGSVLALTANGAVYGWGENTYGQLGMAAIPEVPVPTQVDLSQLSFPGLPTLKAVQVAMGEAFSAVLLEDGSVATTGHNWYGQLGLPGDTRFNREDFGLVNQAWGRSVQRLAVGPAQAFVLLDALPILGISVQPPSLTRVLLGDSFTLNVVATGSNLTYQWYVKDAAGNSTLVGTGPSLTVSGVTYASAGEYYVVISDGVQTATSNSAFVLVTSNGRITSVSMRGPVGDAGHPIIVGFVSQGTGSVPMFVRGVGPGLIPFGVAPADVAGDPEISLNLPFGQVAYNDNWGHDAGLKALFAGAGAFPLVDDSLDAALDSTFVEQSYSVNAVNHGGGGDNILVEMYDGTPQDVTLRVINFSGRAENVGGDEAHALQAGFHIEGDTKVTVLVRAIGPGLNQFGVPNTLADPYVMLFRIPADPAQLPVLLDYNDDWAGAPDLVASGPFALDPTSKDAVLKYQLDPGNYSVELTSNNRGSGTAMIEVYVLP